MRRVAVAIALAAIIVLAGCGSHRGRAAAGRSHLIVATRRPTAAALQAAALERLIKLGYPIFCGGRRGDEVAFTFDDGPGVYTHYALAKLRAAHAQATFFVVGKSIDAWPGWVQREVKLAAIGDHTYTHPFLPALPAAQISAQIATTKRKIERLTGRPVYLFRPPYGGVSRTVDRIVSSLGLLRIMWTVDSADSLGANWLGIIHNVEIGLHPGSIILMHENRGQTIRALTTLLPYVKRRRLRLVTVPELLATDPPTLAQLKAGPEGCSTEAESLHAG